MGTRGGSRSPPPSLRWPTLMGWKPEGAAGGLPPQPHPRSSWMRSCSASPSPALTREPSWGRGAAQSPPVVLLLIVTCSLPTGPESLSVPAPRCSSLGPWGCSWAHKGVPGIFLNPGGLRFQQAVSLPPLCAHKRSPAAPPAPGSLCSDGLKPSLPLAARLPGKPQAQKPQILCPGWLCAARPRARAVSGRCGCPWPGGGCISLR